MKNFPIKTILFGRSILMAGLESALLSDSRITVITLTDDLTELIESSGKNIDLILFDSSVADAKSIPALLGAKTKLMVLGVDFSSHQITFYSGKEFNINNFTDITQIIFNQSDPLFNQ